MPRRKASDRAFRRARWNETLRTGWNRLSYRYRPRTGTSDFFGHREAEYRAWIGPLLNALPPGARVLDLGSGTGVPAARILSERFQVTGVDISDTQVRRARRLVPAARFLRADLDEVDFPPGSFEAVIALYSLIHVPRERQRAVVRKIARWLAPGGWLLAIVGHRPYEGRERGWLGSDAVMLWSHYDSATFRRWLRAEGYRVVREQFVPEGKDGHELFLARTGRRARRPVNARNSAVASGTPTRDPLRQSRARPPRGGRVPPPCP